MPKVTDENKVTWDIRTTNVAVDNNSPRTASWFAAVDDVTAVDYSGNQFPLKDEDFNFGNQVAKLTWPGGGNPIIRGDGNVADATVAVKAFAQRQRVAAQQNPAADTRAIRVTASPDASSGGGAFVLLILLAVVLLSDKKKR